MTYRLAIFDFDGTLADSFPWFLGVVNRLAERAKLRGVLRSSGIAAAEAICIGDEIRDLEAARAEGIAFGAVSWGYTHEEALRAHGPEEMFSDVEEILRKLAG